MPETINIHEAKTHLSRILLRVQAGEEVIIARGGKPVAKLMPLSAKETGARVPGLAKGEVTEAFFEPLPPEELDAWNQ